MHRRQRGRFCPWDFGLSTLQKRMKIDRKGPKFLFESVGFYLTMSWDTDFSRGNWNRITIYIKYRIPQRPQPLAISSSDFIIYYSSNVKTIRRGIGDNLELFSSRSENVSSGIGRIIIGGTRFWKLKCDGGGVWDVDVALGRYSELGDTGVDVTGVRKLGVGLARSVEFESSGATFEKFEIANGFAGIDIIEGEPGKIEVVVNRCGLNDGIVNGVG